MYIIPTTRFGRLGTSVYAYIFKSCLCPTSRWRRRIAWTLEQLLTWPVHSPPPPGTVRIAHAFGCQSNFLYAPPSVSSNFLETDRVAIFQWEVSHCPNHVQCNAHGSEGNSWPRPSAGGYTHAQPHREAPRFSNHTVAIGSEHVVTDSDTSPPDEPRGAVVYLLVVA
eukprot:COSAG02_NODE_6371_length_3618_cov_14.231369_4_plen_167_part_00